MRLFVARTMAKLWIVCTRHTRDRLAEMLIAQSHSRGFGRAFSVNFAQGYRHAAEHISSKHEDALLAAILTTWRGGGVMELTGYQMLEASIEQIRSETRHETEMEWRERIKRLKKHKSEGLEICRAAGLQKATAIALGYIDALNELLEGAE